MPSTPKGKKFHVTRIKSVLQSTTVIAPSEKEAIEASRKLARKNWVDVNDSRRKNYKASLVSYSD